MRRLLAVAALTVAATAGLAGVASAHPLGNFTVNTYSGLQVGTRELRVDYVVDLAEIPTFQARAAVDADGDGQLSAAELAAYAGRSCATSARGMTAVVDGRSVRLSATRSRAEQLPGQAGLPVMRITCGIAGPVSGLHTGSVVTYANRNLDGRLGWHEVTAVGDRTTITSSDVPKNSISNRLMAYPQGQLSAPLDQRSARLVVRPGGAASGSPAEEDRGSVLPRGIDAATSAFTSFVARRDLGLGIGLVAVGLALLLGALHAVAPGHGKTVMAAYLVGRRGSLRCAVTLGATVTATHTAGVLVLGIVLSVSSALAPERLFPVLGLVSGLLLAGIGGWLLRGALRGGAVGHAHPHAHALALGHPQPQDHPRPQPHDHPNPHPHPAPHDHGHAHSHPHTHGHAAHQPARPRLGEVSVYDTPSTDTTTSLERGPGRQPHRKRKPHGSTALPNRRGLVLMGLAGGMVPSPSALVVLLGAIALHRAWFGVLLVVCYGLGMALTLTLAGLLLVRGRSWLDRRQPARWSARLSRALPVGTAGLITLVGLGLALRAAAVVAA